MLFWALACRHEPDPIETPDTADEATMSTEELALWADKYGRVDAEVEVADDVDAILLTGQAPGGYVFVEQIRDPNGDLVLKADQWQFRAQHLSMAVFPQYPEVVSNWPVREEDGPITPGTWTFTFGVLDDDTNWAAGGDLDVTVQRKRDTDLEEGVVHVRIVYAEGVGDDPYVVGGVEAAVEGWREIWQDVGLELVERYDNLDLDPILDDPAPDNEVILEADEGSDPRELTVVIGERVANSNWTYGVAGGIPGPLVHSGRSAVILGWLSFAGIDGELDADDVGVFADTLAHETGHFMGLFHPVETSFDAYDALGDTEECTRQSACERDLGPNLMYPYSLCDASGCDEQNDVTNDQWGVVQRYVGVR